MAGFNKVCITAVNAGYSHSSLAAICLCNALGKKAKVHEYTINDVEAKVVAELYKEFCDLYAFCCYIWNIDFVLDVCKVLKKASPNCKILLGGPEVSYDAKKIMSENEYVDFIICGEGEVAIKELVSGKDYDKIGSIVYRQDDKIIQNAISPITELDKLPRLYTKQSLAVLENKMLYYETSRGCPYNCSYCLSSTSHGVRFFSLERVFEDFILFINCNVKLVKLVDRTFNADISRTKEILRFILANNKSTCFHFEIGADILDDEIIDILCSASKGWFQLEIGIQTTNPKTLEAINRRTNMGRLKANVLRLTESKNMHIHLDLIAGLPYEDYNSFINSFNDVFALAPDMLQLGFLKLLKGTSIRNDAQKYNYAFNPKPPYEVISNDFISYDELLKLKDVSEIVEKYYNSASFEKSLNMALSFFDNAYEFFYNFAVFYSQKGYDKQSQSKQKLYGIFYEFYKEKISKDVPLFCEYLKFDFIKNNKNASLPDWAPRTGDKKFYTSVYEFLKKGEGKECLLPYKNMKLADLIKEVKVERFNFDVCGDGKFGECVVLFDYERKIFTKIDKKF